MRAFIDWQITSAVVQAASAVGVAVMTFFLVRFTGRYVAEMKTANRLQEQANTIAGGWLARSAREDAPFLVSAPAGGSGQRGGPAKSRMIVQNRGGGLAHDITVQTTWGDAPIHSLGTGDKADITFRLDSGWDTSTHPEVRRFLFKDAQGKGWVQEPNQIPVEA
jgi:hypothetical protein